VGIGFESAQPKCDAVQVLTTQTLCRAPGAE
jgi:hypothetical protein